MRLNVEGAKWSSTFYCYETMNKSIVFGYNPETQKLLQIDIAVKLYMWRRRSKLLVVHELSKRLTYLAPSPRDRIFNFLSTFVAVLKKIVGRVQLDLKWLQIGILRSYRWRRKMMGSSFRNWESSEDDKNKAFIVLPSQKRLYLHIILNWL